MMHTCYVICLSMDLVYSLMRSVNEIVLADEFIHDLCTW